MRARGGGGRAGDDRHGSEDREGTDHPHDGAVGRSARGELLALMAGAPDEHDGGDEYQHREREVAHHPAVVQGAFDGEAAEDGLPNHAQRQQAADPREVPPVGPAAQGEDPGGARRDADREGQQPVGELDHCVRVQGRIDVPVALRPCGAAETGSCQADGGAGRDDRGERTQRHPRDPHVLGGGDRVPVGARTHALEKAGHPPKDATGTEARARLRPASGPTRRGRIPSAPRAAGAR